MKKSSFTEQQIAFALQQAESGTSVEEVCRKMGISQATFFRWKKVYGGPMPSEVRKLKMLKEENRRLRKLVADRTLEMTMLTEVIKKGSDGGTGARDDRPGPHRLSCLDPARLLRGAGVAGVLPPPFGSPRPGSVAQTHSRDRRNTGAPWLPPR